MSRGRKRRKKKEDVEGDSEESAAVRDSESDSVLSEEDADNVEARAKYCFLEENWYSKLKVVSNMLYLLNPPSSPFIVISPLHELLNLKQIKNPMYRRTAIPYK